MTPKLQLGDVITPHTPPDLTSPSCADIIIPTPNPRYQFHAHEDTDDGIVSDSALIRETWAENVYQIHESDFTDTGVLVDIGANIGVVSVYAAAMGARVIAVEPDANNRELLVRNLIENGVADRVTIYPKAVSDHRGTGYLTPRRGNSKLYGQPQSNARQVDVVTLADVFSDNGIPGCDVLKIDVEGSECDIIAGASAEVLRLARYLVLEFEATPDHQFGAMVTSIAKWFNTHIIGSPERGGYIYGHRY